MDQALGTAEPPASSGPEQRSSAAAAPGMPAAAADKAFKEPTPALIMRHCCCTLPFALLLPALPCTWSLQQALWPRRPCLLLASRPVHA